MVAPFKNKTIRRTNHAKGTILINLRIRKLVIFASLVKIVVIRKPDKMKKITIPVDAIAPFSFHELSPKGSKCPVMTNNILTPLHPSKTSNLFFNLVSF
jgi:hypothetical protein